MKGSFTIKKVSLSLFCLLLYKLSFAQLLAWDFSTKTGTVSGPIVATANHPDLEISSLSRGAKGLGESNLIILIFLLIQQTVRPRRMLFQKDRITFLQLSQESTTSFL